MTAKGAAGPAAAFVQIQDVRKEFRQGGRVQVVLDQASFTLARGETVALLGRSGSGKTTLLNLLSGIDLVDAGHLLVDGIDLASMPERERTLFRRHNIGFIFQFFNLVPGLTALENVALMAELNGLPVSAAMARAEEALTLLQMADKADSWPEQLSGGEQQRVAIARALVHAPQLVLADEPTGNLDAVTGQQVLQVMRDFLRQRQATTLLVTHSLAVAQTADRILTLEDGHVETRSGDFAW